MFNTNQWILLGFFILVAYIIFLSDKMRKLENRVLVEGMAGALSDEAIQNIASIFNNNDELVVPKLRVTGEVNIGGNINVGGDGVIGNAYIGKLTRSDYNFTQVCHKDAANGPNGYVVEKSGSPSVGISKGGQFVMVDYNNNKAVITASNNNFVLDTNTTIKGDANITGNTITNNLYVKKDLGFNGSSDTDAKWKIFAEDNGNILNTMFKVDPKGSGPWSDDKYLMSRWSFNTGRKPTLTYYVQQSIPGTNFYIRTGEGAVFRNNWGGKFEGGGGPE